MKKIERNDVQYNLMLESIEEKFTVGKKYNLCVSVIDDLSKYMSVNKTENNVVVWFPSREYKDYHTL